MSNPLFEFVKVAAGEPFPFPNGHYNYSTTVGRKIMMKAMVRDSTWPNDRYILRPAESPDSGREGVKPTIEFDEVENGVTASIAVGNQISISEGTDKQEAYNELIYSLDIGLAHEHGLRSVISITAESALSTPADPGSQVEAGYTEEQVREAIEMAQQWIAEMDGNYVYHYSGPKYTPDEIIKQLNP